MRDWEGFNVPSKPSMMELLFPRVETRQSHPDGVAGEHRQQWSDPARAQPRRMEDSTEPTMDSSRFEILERWDGNKVMAVLNRKLVIRNEEHDWGPTRT